MVKANQDILTTADAAKLLGVSVRTAQLLVEGGTLPSWKTPGGHRRLYRADVMALIDGGTPTAVSPPSAKLIIIAGPGRRTLYDALFARVAECAAESYDDVLAALIAIGSTHPHAILVDMEPDGIDPVPLLHSLVAHPALRDSLLVAVGLKGPLPDLLAGRVTVLAAPADAVAAIRASLGDGTAVAMPAPDPASPFPLALNEGQRLAALERSGLLAGPPEEALDRLTWLAANLLSAPIALLTLLTPTHQFFKSRVGLDMVETPRSWAFCNHTIMQKSVFTVEDLAADPRFVANPAVAGAPWFRFYAGAPVLDGDGFAVGSLCVIDRRPRRLDPREAQGIQMLAALGSDHLRLRALEKAPRDRQSGDGANARPTRALRRIQPA